METLCMDWKGGVEDFKWKYITPHDGEIVGQEVWVKPSSISTVEYHKDKVIIKRAKDNKEFIKLLDEYGEEYEIKFYSRDAYREYIMGCVEWK